MNVPPSVASVSPRTAPLSAIAHGVISSLPCHYPDADEDLTFQDVIEYSAAGDQGESGASFTDCAGNSTVCIFTPPQSSLTR
jgi:hypothetical protein